MLSTGKKYGNNPTRTSILPLAFSSVLLCWDSGDSRTGLAHSWRRNPPRRSWTSSSRRPEGTYSPASAGSWSALTATELGSTVSLPVCLNNKSHQLDTLMLTQIIAGDALEEVNTKLKLLTKLRATNGTEKKLEIPDSGSSAATVFKDETDVKPEAPVDGEEVRSDQFL